MLGYGYISSENYPEDSDEKFTVNEHRIFQQYITKQKYGRFNIMHRYCFGQRFVEDEFLMRLRYFLLLNIPINQPEMVDGVVYASAYNEIFLATESPVLDRNRIYAGFGYRFSKIFRAEAGYMVQLFEKNKS